MAEISLKNLKLFAGLLMALVATLSIVRSDEAEIDIYADFLQVIDPPQFCKKLAANITKTVLKSLSVCGGEMKKLKKVKGQKFERDGIATCGVRCALKRLKLVKDDYVHITPEDTNNFVSAISKPAFVEVGRIVIQNCIDEFHKVPEELTRTKCPPFVDLLKCMQENLAFVTTKCG